MNETVAIALIMLLIVAGFGFMAYLIHNIGIKINGRMTDMMESVKKLAHQQGMEEERALHEHH